MVPEGHGQLPGRMGSTDERRCGQCRGGERCGLDELPSGSLQTLHWDPSLSRRHLRTVLPARWRISPLALKSRHGSNRGARPTLQGIREVGEQRELAGVGQCRDSAAWLPHTRGPASLFAYHSAWREGEELALRWGDRRPASGREVRLADSTNDEPRSLPLEGELALTIDRRWTARVVGAKTTLRGWWRDPATGAGHPGLVFHDIRRAGIRNMIRAGVSGPVAMSISGHRGVGVFRPLQHHHDREPASSTPADRGEDPDRSSPSVRANPASDHEQPVVVPQVMHLRQVPLRTMVNWPHSPHGSPS